MLFLFEAPWRFQKHMELLKYAAYEKNIMYVESSDIQQPAISIRIASILMEILRLHLTESLGLEHKRFQRNQHKIYGTQLDSHI